MREGGVEEEVRESEEGEGGGGDEDGGFAGGGVQVCVGYVPVRDCSGWLIGAEDWWW